MATPVNYQWLDDPTLAPKKSAGLGGTIQAASTDVKPLSVGIGTPEGSPGPTPGTNNDTQAFSAPIVPPTGLSAVINGATPPSAATPTDTTGSFADLLGPDKKVSDAQVQLADELAKPVGTDTTADTQARAQLDTTNAEAERKAAEQSALLGRAATGQIQGDSRIAQDKSIAAKGALEGQLTASANVTDAASRKSALETLLGNEQANETQQSSQDFAKSQQDSSQAAAKSLAEEQMASQEKLATAQLAQSDAQFQSQLGLNKDQLAAQVQSQKDQLGVQLGQLDLDKQKTAQALQDDKVNQAVQLATTLSTIYGDDPATQLQAATLVFDSLKEGGYISDAQYANGILNANASQYDTVSDFTTWAKKSGYTDAQIAPIVAENSGDKGQKWSADTGTTATGTTAKVTPQGTGEQYDAATSYLDSILPKESLAVTNNQPKIESLLNNLAAGKISGAANNNQKQSDQDYQQQLNALGLSPLATRNLLEKTIGTDRLYAINNYYNPHPANEAQLKAGGLVWDASQGVWTTPAKAGTGKV